MNLDLYRELINYISIHQIAGKKITGEQVDYLPYF